MTMFPETEDATPLDKPCVECEEDGIGFNLPKINQDIELIRRDIRRMSRDNELRFLFLAGAIILVYAKVK